LLGGGRTSRCTPRTALLRFLDIRLKRSRRKKQGSQLASVPHSLVKRKMSARCYLKQEGRSI